MHKDWPTYYSVLVIVSALIALVMIVWFLLRGADRVVLLAALVLAAAVFWATWGPGTGYCC